MIAPGKGVMSQKYFTEAKNHIVHSFRFEHPSFVFNRSDQGQARTLFHTLLHHGQITYEPTRKDLWVTSDMVQSFAAALVTNSLVDGCRSWDVVVAKWLSIVLQAALCSKAGDILQDEDWDEDTFLRWRDVSINIDENDGGFHLSGTVTLLHNDESMDVKGPCQVRFRKLNDSYAKVDPLKLLLIHALRQGMVAEKDWASLLLETGQRPDHTVVWSSPNEPVFRAIHRDRLDSTTPCGMRQQEVIIRELGNAIGMLPVPNSTDLRRGAARQIAFCTTGDLSDTWAARLGGELDRVFERFYRPEFGLEAHHEAEITSTDIEKRCTSDSLDHSKKSDRIKARRNIEREHRAQWVEEQKVKLDQPNIVSAVVPHTDRDMATETLNTAADQSQRRVRPRLEDQSTLMIPPAWTRHVSRWTKSGSPRPVIEETKDKKDSDRCIRDVPEVSRLLTSDTNTFIEFFCRINVVQLSSHEHPAEIAAQPNSPDLVVQRGNSRDEPSWKKSWDGSIQSATAVGDSTLV